MYIYLGDHINVPGLCYIQYVYDIFCAQRMTKAQELRPTNPQAYGPYGMTVINTLQY